MTTQIACSACRAVFAAGAGSCPNCGLQLTAQALPVKQIERPRSPLWPVILGAILILVLIMSIADRSQQRDSNSAKANFVAAAAAGQLNSPEAFEARCGAPRTAAATKRGTELHYSSGYSGLEWIVTLKSASPIFQMDHINYRSNGTVDEWRDTRDAAAFFDQGHCK